MSRCRHTAASASSEPRSSTVPVGLCGELTRMARVEGVSAASRSAGAIWKAFSGLSGIVRMRAPLAPMVAS